ncbi:MAG: hypothetical protein AB8B80_05425 [Marinicellaceae bacterium]
MKIETQSIRTFIGAKDYNVSRNFYREIGFEEVIISENMSLFTLGKIGFYLQDYYAKDWIDNSMVFLEVDDMKGALNDLKKLQLTKRYDNVKLSKIHRNDWGNEFFLHDPSGVLWHIGEFN